MIKFTNSKITKETIEQINVLLDKEIHATSAFRIARIVKELSSIIESKNKAEEIIYKKWVIFDEDGTPVPVKDENGEILPNLVSLKDVELFNKEMAELMEFENEINLPKLKFEDLNLNENIKPRDLFSIDFIFE